MNILRGKEENCKRQHCCKITVLLIVTVFFMISVSGCNKSIKITTGLKDDVIFKLSDKQCSLPQILVVLINEKNMYEKDFGQGIWEKKVQDMSMEESVKDGIKEQQIYMDAMYQLAEERKVILSDGEEQKIADASKEYFDTLTDTEKSLMNVTVEDIEDIYRKSLMGKKVYDSIVGQKEYEISDEEARVMSAMYIYVEGKNEESYGKATQAYEKVKSGADFYTVAAEYSDDEIIQIDLGREGFVEEIEKAAFELAPDEYTEIIETDKGYYIVKCVESYLKDKTESNKTQILTNRQNEEFLKVFNPFLEKLQLDFNEKVWEKIKLSDYEQCTTASLFDIYNKYFEE